MRIQHRPHRARPLVARPSAARLPGIAARVVSAAAPLAASLGMAFGLSVAASLAMLPAAHAQQRLLTVPKVDLQRYAGTWHEIARLPNRFQAQCVSEVTATYTPNPDGTVGVVNRCKAEDGSVDVAEGVARPQDATNAKLKVTFLPSALRWLPFGQGDYWVLDIDPDYRWVLVGEPGRQYMWLLSRQPILAQDTLELVLGRAREMGFAVDKVKLSAQKPPGATTVPVPPPPPPSETASPTSPR